MLELNKIYQGDCLIKLKELEDNSVDSIVTDPPYELGFMGKSWDNTGIAYNVELWKECLRVLKPGGHLLAFSGTRTYHRMASAIEDAGFEIRDMIEWVYGSGFPKSLAIGKAIDKINGRFYDKNFKSYCNECRLKKGYSHNKVNELMNVATTGGGFSSSIMGDKEFNELPTLEMYNKLKAILELDNRYDELIRKTEAEREVIGKKISGIGTAFGEGEWKSGKAEEVDITIPTTEQAKQWEGWGTAMKPSHEPICMARKPLAEKTVAENVLKYGTGGINIDESRVETTEETRRAKSGWQDNGYVGGEYDNEKYDAFKSRENNGRFPANLILSWKEDEYILKDNITKEQKENALRWIYENV